MKSHGEELDAEDNIILAINIGDKKLQKKSLFGFATKLENLTKVIMRPNLFYI